MERFYTVDILTPNKVVAKDIPATSILVPTCRGQINLLSDHTHIVTNLEPGQLSIFGGADDSDRHFTVTNGICKVLEDKIRILTTTSEENHEIDAERAERALAQAEDVLASNANLSDEEIQKYRRKIERANLRIQLSKLSK